VIYGKGFMQTDEKTNKTEIEKWFKVITTK